jgi:hypothetical protein
VVDAIVVQHVMKRACRSRPRGGRPQPLAVREGQLGHLGPRMGLAPRGEEGRGSSPPPREGPRDSDSL